MRVWLAVAFLAMPISSAAAATINVPAGGNLQAALNAAQPGDVITLQPGATYIGNFVLPNKGALSAFITIRSAAADSALPAAGVRITPAYAAMLPKIRSGNSAAAISTAAATNHWKLMFLEFQANQNGYGDIIDLGHGRLDADAAVAGAVRARARSRLRPRRSGDGAEARRRREQQRHAGAELVDSGL